MLKTRNIVIVTIIGIAIVFAWNYKSRNDEKKAIQRHQYEIDMAVSEIPSSDLKVWIRFIEERIEKEISNVGKSTWMIYDNKRTYGIFNEPICISKNMPYKISCHQFSWGIFITFGIGDNTTSFQVYGWNVDGPQLTIKQRSVAAKKLQEILCHRVALAMDKKS